MLAHRVQYDFYTEGVSNLCPNVASMNPTQHHLLIGITSRCLITSQPIRYRSEFCEKFRIASRQTAIPSAAAILERVSQLPEVR